MHLQIYTISLKNQLFFMEYFISKILFVQNLLNRINYRYIDQIYTFYSIDFNINLSNFKI